MRDVILLGLVIMISGVACGRSESARFVLENNKVERVEDCHLFMNAWNATDERGGPWAVLEFACGVPESVQHEKEWWGDKPHPLGFTVSVGDCLLLGEKFYCVESIEPGKTTFKATYKWATRHQNHLERLR
ncbi:hypothetical protein [Polyangium sp. 6x1]|uniref:hypothetical protein n=1 Tax=Polyangium sp. 6x1 TaxID=3042689 RepID=UPI0024824C5E|nr:hypothetical protein [Polyangium sp. 6x1]MDI1449519.1 hypothetical protein [Polyangium sp. 6x1]